MPVHKSSSAKKSKPTANRRSSATSAANPENADAFLACDLALSLLTSARYVQLDVQRTAGAPFDTQRFTLQEARIAAMAAAETVRIVDRLKQLIGRTPINNALQIANGSRPVRVAGKLHKSYCHAALAVGKSLYLHLLIVLSAETSSN